MGFRGLQLWRQTPHIGCITRACHEVFHQSRLGMIVAFNNGRPIDDQITV